MGIYEGQRDRVRDKYDSVSKYLILEYKSSYYILSLTSQQYLLKDNIYVVLHRTWTW